jgi:nitroimidazol reductase NimA-like FMN-containing flavoprotein (pyridoxamine 5'-phosphate oxidase superfamily)
MTVVKLPKMDDKEIKNALESENICRIAFIEDNFPYISPFQYVYMNGNLYFHFTDYGKKKKILEKNNNVCVSIEKFAENLSNYFFISMQGQLLRCENENEKNEVLRIMVKNAKDNFSSNFLSAHGFDKGDGWDGFQTDNQLIYKFEQIGKTIALKSL